MIKNDAQSPLWDTTKKIGTSNELMWTLVALGVLGVAVATFGATSLYTNLHQAAEQISHGATLLSEPLSIAATAAGGSDALLCALAIILNRHYKVEEREEFIVEEPIHIDIEREREYSDDGSTIEQEDFDIESGGEIVAIPTEEESSIEEPQPQPQQQPRKELTIRDTLPKYVFSENGMIGDSHLMYHFEERLKWGYSERKIPTRSGNGNLMDTVFIPQDTKYVNGPGSPCIDNQGYAESLSQRDVFSAIIVPDDQILTIHRCTSVKPLTQKASSFSSMLFAGITEDDRHIIQQPGVRACVPTAIAMLLLDNGVQELDTSRLFNVSLSEIENEESLMTEYGFKAVKLEIETAETLHNTITKSGSLLFTTNLCGGHQMIVDRIDLEKNRATVRDPWHGWSIDVSVDYFMTTLSCSTQYHYLEPI